MSANRLNWVHFGDVHIKEREDENYQDFVDLIAEANEHLAGAVDFAFLPGDNAEDGTAEQYKLVAEAIQKLRIPLKTITGDHDRKGGSLDLYRKYLEPELFRAESIGDFHLLFLNALDGPQKEEFDLSGEQLDWVKTQLKEARNRNLRPLLFTHLYPSELLTQGSALSKLIGEFGVELVEMGHTHYNELANDGHTIYAATRSTGQIEEGPSGFSLTSIDGDVISWKFKARREWPLVMITSPADQLLVTKPGSKEHVIRGNITVRARAWGVSKIETFQCRIDDNAPQKMELVEDQWILPWDSTAASDGVHQINVHVFAVDGRIGGDEISVLVNQAGHYEPPRRNAIDYENVIGAYPAKSILGTQLGPNENGTKGPWPSWRNE